MLTLSAPAKVNLVLEVIERRETYHVISSVAQTLDLCDRLTVEAADAVRFTCSEPALEQDNLVMRAAGLLRTRFGIRAGARIHLEKHIPWAAGLGGGSSDAAAALKALNELWRLDLPKEQLVNIGADLGSDVPLFLIEGTVLIEGRGELARRLADHPVVYAVLVVPNCAPPEGKTGLMYRQLRPEMFTRGQYVRAARFALERGKRIPEELLFNVFEKVAEGVYPRIARDRLQLEQASGVRAHLAGSGPCLYALLPSETAAEAAAAKLNDAGSRVLVARTLR